MATDDLSAPLGQSRPRKSPARIRAPYLIAGTVLLAALLVVAWRLAGDRHHGGQPSANATIVPDVTGAPAAGAGPFAPPPLRQAAPAEPVVPDDKPTGSIPPAEAKAGPGLTTITIIDGSSGHRRQVTVPDANAARVRGQ